MINRTLVQHAGLTVFALYLLAAAQIHAAEPTAPAGPPALITGTAVCERARRIVVSLAGPAELAGVPLELLQGEASIATCSLALGAGGAATTISLPMPPPGCIMGSMKIMARGKALGNIYMPDTVRARMEALYETPIRFHQTVFTGEKFPACEFEQPALAEALAGQYAIKARFFDKDYNETTTASTDGRYGAVVEVKGEGGLTCRRFLTLCRVSKPVKWRELDLCLGPGSAKVLGISPATLDACHVEIEDAIKWDLRNSFASSPGSASLMAWLSESKKSRGNAGTGDPRKAEETWWFGLKKRLGMIEHHYLTFLPHEYMRNCARRFPLIIFLHGAGERGLDLNLVRAHGPHKYLSEHIESPFIVIEPQCPPGGWWNSGEVLDLLDEICAKYRIDPERIYLTGLSMGGYGTWSTIPEAPGRFAAAVPICGAGNPKDAAKLKDTPLWVFHGTKDSVVPVERSREMVRAVKRAGGKVKLTEYPDADHDSWTETYSNPALYEWLLKHKRPQP